MCLIYLISIVVCFTLTFLLHFKQFLHQINLFYKKHYNKHNYTFFPIYFLFLFGLLEAAAVTDLATGSTVFPIPAFKLVLLAV